MPVPAEKAKQPHQPKTLPHAISRAAKAGAVELGAGDKLGTALGVYGSAMEKVIFNRAGRGAICGMES